MGNTLTLRTQDGETVVCDVLFTFDSEETGKSYVVYTDNSKDESGNINVFASVYDPTGEDPTLGAVETDEEWEVIETIMHQLMEDIRRKAGITEE